VLAKVGNANITLQDFQREVEWYTRNQRSLPEKQALLDEMISREARLQRARALGLDQDPDLRRHCDSLLIGKLEQRELRPKLDQMEVPTEEVRAAYDKDIARYTHQAKARLAIIFIQADAKMGAARMAELEGRIAEARKQTLDLPAGTRGFGKVAMDFSEDQASRYRGGDVGWFDQGLKDYRLPAEVVTAGFDLKSPGDISDVIKTAKGFYLVSRIEVRPVTTVPLATVQPTIQRRLLADKRQEGQMAFDQEMRRMAPVQTFPAVLATAPYPGTTLAKAERGIPASPAATDSANGN
jgi:parvulin-like peptidyl-prolyl isomerase